MVIIFITLISKTKIPNLLKYSQGGDDDDDEDDAENIGDDINRKKMMMENHNCKTYG